MACTRYQTDGMRWIDGEMTPEEASAYETHVRTCEDCARELDQLGRVVRYAEELTLRVSDQKFWDGYWESIYRRSERGAGFLLLILGLLAITGYGIYRAVTSPRFLTYEGISVTIILGGLAIIFISVVRERYYERKNDPYREVER